MSCKNCGLPNPTHPAHGTQSGYCYHKCRCLLCKGWNTNAARLQRKINAEYYLEYNRKRAKTPKRQEQRKKYCKENAKELGKKSAEYRKANLERYRAHEIRRRIALTKNMSKEDKEISIAYRKAISNDGCFYCKSNKGEQDDHYFPISKGGSDYWYNLRRSCTKCNNAKRARCGTFFLLKRK